jgi:hypothetical protein
MNIVLYILGYILNIILFILYIKNMRASTTYKKRYFKQYIPLALVFSLGSYILTTFIILLIIISFIFKCISIPFKKLFDYLEKCIFK